MPTGICRASHCCVGEREVRVAQVAVGHRAVTRENAPAGASAGRSREQQGARPARALAANARRRARGAGAQRRPPCAHRSQRSTAGRGRPGRAGGTAAGPRPPGRPSRPRRGESGSGGRSPICSSAGPAGSVGELDGGDLRGELGHARCGRRRAPSPTTSRSPRAERDVHRAGVGVDAVERDARSRGCPAGAVRRPARARPASGRSTGCRSCRASSAATSGSAASRWTSVVARRRAGRSRQLGPARRRRTA